MGAARDGSRGLFRQLSSASEMLPLPNMPHRVDAAWLGMKRDGSLAHSSLSTAVAQCPRTMFATQCPHHPPCSRKI